MLLRKINAVLSLLCTFLLMDHAIFHAIWMMAKGNIEKSTDNLPWILFGLMLMHAFISVYLGVAAHADTEKRKCKSYPKMNVATIIQRASGVVLILLAVQHVLGVSGAWPVPPIVHMILPPLFFTVALMHAAISGVKALITLGIGNAKFIKTADIVVKVLCVITIIADIVGFYIYIG